MAASPGSLWGSLLSSFWSLWCSDFFNKDSKMHLPGKALFCALDLHMQMNTGHCPLMVWEAPQIWLIQNRCSHVFLPPLPPKPGDSHFLGHSGGNLESHPAISLNGLSGPVSHTPHDLSYLFLFLNHHHHSLVSDSQNISRIVLIAFPPVTLAPSHPRCCLTLIQQRRELSLRVDGRAGR